MAKTLRLIAPDWQAGNKPTYYFGAELLAWLAPQNPNQTQIHLEIAQPEGQTLTKENGVVAQTMVKQNVQQAIQQIEQQQPDKIITFGGNCLVSQAPFDYLNGRYKQNLGVIWIDSHPDISTPQDFYHEHAMVLGNLLGKGDPELAKLVKTPLQAQQFCFVGLQKLLDYEYQRMQQLGLDYQIQDQNILSPQAIDSWVEKHQFEHIAIHLDLDVLDPNWFKSLYFNEPGVTEFPAESGKMTPQYLLQLLQHLFKQHNIVGLTIAEYLPWDAVYLQQLFAQLNIFKN